MIDIAINTSAGTAALTARNPIKAGGLVPVAVKFSANPGTVTHLDLSLSEDSSDATTAAYLETWEQQNETTHTGWLDANDTRLLALLSGSTARSVVCEVSWTVDGKRRVAPNFGLTVQRPIVTGPESSEGGPSYYTATEIDAFFSELAAADVGLGNVTNDAQVKRAEMGVAGGVATLEVETGKIPLSQLPDLGAVRYKGVWDATTNTPDVTALDLQIGWAWRVSVAGTADPDGAGREFEPNDWIVYNGETWDKFDNTSPLATKILAGMVRLASKMETNQRRADDIAVTPADLRDANAETLTGDKTLVAGDTPQQLLDPNGVDRDVILPVIAPSPMGDQVGYGHPIRIYNTGTGAALVIKDSSSTQQARIDYGGMAEFVATASGWSSMQAPRNGPMVVSYPVDISVGSALDTLTIYTPVTGLRGSIIAARWITDSTSGTISTEGQVKLLAGSTAVSSTLSLSTSPTVDYERDFSLSSPRRVFSNSSPLKIEKTQIVVGGSHIGTVVVTIVLL